MTETATSPRYHAPPSSSISSKPPTTTPAARPPNRPGSVGQTHTPHFMSSSRPLTTPYQSIPTARAPSPSYFGFPATSSPPHSKHNWSPPSSTVRSTAAASPSLLPVDQNPDFDAFKRQSDNGKAFNLGTLNHHIGAHGSPVVQRSTSRAGQSNGRLRARSSFSKDVTATEIKSQALEPPPNELSRSPKRMLSPGSMVLPEEVRRASPASFAQNETETKHPRRVSASSPRFALPLDGSSNMAAAPVSRAETISTAAQGDQQLMTTPQHVINLLDSRHEEVLVLDLRVSTQYAQSHITGALSLCIPTTLLKRPSFNVQKLADTFKDEKQRQKFESWRTCTHIVVYDASSAVLKDAQIPLNTIKKFRSEGYEGTLYIVKGGFNKFSRSFPSYVASGVDSSHDDASAQAVDSDGPEVAPVIGGCPMPSTENPANPFFGNIRQNMDLIGGVGQMPLQHPASATESAEREFPEWLQKAADKQDEGSGVSKKFELIERREKKRMEDALSGKVCFGTSSPQAQPEPEKGVQIAGLEKGNKNRYNNIWPFEHSRVKLQGVPNHGCDYFNANHIQASWSNKRYISTQAPIPATFNDFWNVVWQQDVRVIVMLTAEKEGPQVKAHNYWDKKQYGPLRLEFLSEKRASLEPARIRRHQQLRRANKRSSTNGSNLFTPIEPPSATEDKFSFSTSTSSASAAASSATDSNPHVTVRRFTLSHERFPFAPIREITQLHYPHWPDFGAPTHPAHLLGLVEQTDVVARASSSSKFSSPTSATTKGAAAGNSVGGDTPAPPNERPVLVHCSAGCGRTGTFCTVDSVIDMLKRQRLSRAHHDDLDHEEDGDVKDLGHLPDREVSSKPDEVMQEDGKGEKECTPMDIDRNSAAPPPPPVSPATACSAAAVPSAAVPPPLHHSTSSSTTTATFASLNSNSTTHDPFPRNQPIRFKDSDADDQVTAEPDAIIEQGAWLGHDDLDLVEKCVEDFRLQRLSMVQSLRQFVLCYESVMEWCVEERMAAGEEGVK